MVSLETDDLTSHKFYLANPSFLNTTNAFSENASLREI